jgi:DNA (cytosine-5)-methyltransferase 1
MKNNLTLGSLFSGSGGFELGGLLSGIEPIWVSELEPFPIRVTTKRLPQVKHLGDITKINGGEIQPVDIVTCGSPCQNLSQAGNRKGLAGEKSSLFYQAIRIVKEMRGKTNGSYPRYIVWENVCGAFSSNKGEDFRSVLEAICRIKEEGVAISKPKKWTRAGQIVGDDYSIAWRVLDAQYWGVPQRRKRIFLIADFDGQSASKILFESEGVSGYSHESFKAWQKATDSFGVGINQSSDFCLNDQGGERMDVSDNITGTLRAQANHPPLVFENHGQDSCYTGPLETAQTILATYGTGGNNQPFVVEPKTYDVRLTSEGTINARANVYESDTSRTIDTSGNAPDSNQGGIAVVSVQGSMIGRSDENGPQGSGINEDVSFTLNTVDKHAVCYSTSKNTHHTRATKELAGTLVASDYKDPPLVNEQSYVVRRLTPRECARLQGFPSWWCDDLETEVPTEEDLLFWRKVFESYRLAVKPHTKPKTDKQIIKWLKNPHSDSAEYKLWGNGVALPCVVFVLSGIAWAHENCIN